MAKSKRPPKRGGSKKQQRAEDAETEAVRRNSGQVDAAVAALAAEFTSLDQRISALNEKKSEKLNAFKEQFGISKGAFRQAYRDSQREGAEKATHVANYLTCARALGVMADLPLGKAAVNQFVKAAQVQADEATAAEAAAREPEAAANGDDEPEPAIH